jgi:hypothetical protein
MSKLTAEHLAHVVVRDARGDEAALGGLWREHAVVLVWVRHFGCIACRSHVASLRPHLEEIQRLGDLAIIGNGSVEQARRFSELMNLGRMKVFSDEALTSYRLAGLRRGWWTLLRPAALVEHLRYRLRGERNKGLRGDLLQQGGTLVVARSGEVHFRHVSRAWGDNAAVTDILAALSVAADPGKPTD